MIPLRRLKRLVQFVLAGVILVAFYYIHVQVPEYADQNLFELAQGAPKQRLVGPRVDGIFI